MKNIEKKCRSYAFVCPAFFDESICNLLAWNSDQQQLAAFALISEVGLTIAVVTSPGAFSAIANAPVQ
jgi:hypothetical protein